ncbi:MAG: FMN-binding negative transcriptional regulator [Sphingopyxis sp.]|nr:FMN-binding negative transcriptional regulator [Sphingopyxis sp.]
MHPNPAFRPKQDDIAALLVREIGFAAIFLTTPDGPRVAHAPVLLADDDRTLRFHLARGNALTKHLDGAAPLAVVQGPDAYVSPGDYGDTAQVPTWNYITVEMEGRARQTSRDSLITLLDDVSAAHEQRISADPAWTRAKMDPAQFSRMVDAIVGFEIGVTAWRPTLKLSQNKPAVMAAKVQHALAARGHSALAQLMQHLASGEKPHES